MAEQQQQQQWQQQQQQQQQQKQAFAHPVIETAQETKKTGTATAVGIGAAGILAALLFR